MKFTLFATNIPVDQVLAVGRAADQCGWHAMALPDCVFHPEQVTGDYPYSEDGLRHWDPEIPFVDPYTAIPALAAVTENLHFYSAVLKAVLRQPLLLAKALGTAEAMFPGRIALGVGTSWMLEETGNAPGVSSASGTAPLRSLQPQPPGSAPVNGCTSRC